MDENNANVKIVINHDKDGNVVFPVTRANAVILNDEDNTSLETVLKENKETMDIIHENVDAIDGIKEIKNKLDEHSEAGQDIDELLYAEDESEEFEEVFTKYKILRDIDLEMDVDNIINYSDKLIKLIKYIQKIDKEAVGHDQIEDVDDSRVSLITARQEISDLKAEIAKLKGDIKAVNNKVDGFLLSDIYANIKDNLIEDINNNYITEIRNEISSIKTLMGSHNVRLSALETATNLMEQDINNIYKIFGVDNIQDLPEDKSVSDLLAALYAISKDFIEWKDN